jgi:hypothetical protein
MQHSEGRLRRDYETVTFPLRLDNNSVKDSVKEVIKPHEGLRRHTTRLHQENGCVVILFYDEGMHLTEHSTHLKAQAGQYL